MPRRPPAPRAGPAGQPGAEARVQEVEFGRLDQALGDVRMVGLEQVHDARCFEHRQPVLGGVGRHVRVPGEFGHVQQLGGACGAGPHEAQERRLVADAGQVAYVPLQVGLDVRAEVEVPIQPRIAGQRRVAPRQMRRYSSGSGSGAAGPGGGGGGGEEIWHLTGGFFKGARPWPPVGGSISAPSDLGRQPVARVEVEGLVLALTFADGRFAAVDARCAQRGGRWTRDARGRVCRLPVARLELRSRPGPSARPRPGRACLYSGGARGARAGGCRLREQPGPGHHREPSARRGDRAQGGAGARGGHFHHRDEPAVSARFDLGTPARGGARPCRADAGRRTRLLQLECLKFRHCEGYYSKSAQACTWPCSITQMDPADQMEQVYEALVHWADVVAGGDAHPLGRCQLPLYKMAERLNCIQNQITIDDRVLIRNKVAVFIITGGQDNIQGVPGQMLTFFSELGFHFPQFPFIAHSRGWDAEDMERNIEVVEASESLHEGARQLVSRAVGMATLLLGQGAGESSTPRGGGKALPVRKAR